MVDAKLLIVQGDPGSECLEKRLRGLGYEVCAAVSCGRQAIEKAVALRPDLALIDLELNGDVNGIDVAEGIDIPAIYLTDGAEEKLLRRAQATHPFGYVLKPIEDRQLHLNIQTALSMREREGKCRQKKTLWKQRIAELQNQTSLMETIFHNISDGVIVADTTGKFNLVNPSVRRITGIDTMDYVPDKWSDRYGVFYSDRETAVPADELPLARAMRGESTDDVELFVKNQKKPDGVYISVSGRPLIDGEGVLKGGLVVLRDITKRKKSEAELAQTITELQNQTRLMKIVFNSISDGVIAVGKDGEHLVCNRSAKRMGGTHRPNSRANRWSEKYGIFRPDKETLVPFNELPLVRALRGERVDSEECFVRNRRRPQGVYMSVSARPLRDSAGTLKGGVIVTRDITKLKQTEAELKQTIADLKSQTQLMETVFNSISDGVVVGDAEGKFSIFNPNAQQIVGIGMLDAPPDQWTDQYGIFFPDQKTPMPMDGLPLVRAIRGESTDNIELFIRNEKKPDGVYISVNGRPLATNIGDHGGGVIVFRDITKEKKSEVELEQTMRELQSHNELMEATFNSISDGIVVADEGGNFLYVNPRAEEIVGLGETDTSPDEWPETYGCFYADRKTLVKTEDLPLIRAISSGESVDDVDLFIRNERKPDGVYIRVSARPLSNDRGEIKRGVITFRNVTDQVVATEALERAFAQGRLEIVDTILHNIGNAINSITIGIETVHQNLMEDHLTRRLCALADAIKARRDDWDDYLKNDAQGQKVMPFILALAEDFSKRNAAWAKTVDRVRDRAKHIADIVRTQKALGNPSVDRKDIDLRDALEDAVRVLQDSIVKRRIGIEIDCKNAPKEIRVQESQFHQMMVNLIKNSVEAIDERITSGGLEEKPRIWIRGYIEESFLGIEVRDNGIGIDDEVLKKLFAAGYTTKKSGTGLGLHSAANFVIGAGGQIYPLSDGAGKGTTMHVKLPLVSVPPPPPQI